MNRVLMGALFLTLCACHTQAARVRCDDKLQPINAAAPIIKAPAATSVSTP